MGKILSYKHGEGSVKGLDPRLWDIAQASIAAMPYDAQIRSAAERGKGDKGNHSGGHAIDVTFFDKNGNRIPDTGKTGGVNSAVIYEQWAKTARAIQQEKYPELNKTFRWGGGFRQGYPFDFMHLDITPSRGGSMAYYNWDTGWNSAAYSALPGLKEASGKPVPPLGLLNEAFPVTASRQIDQKRMQFDAQLQNTPLPRPRPGTPVAAPGGLPRPTQTIDPTMRNAMSAVPAASNMSPALQAARQRLTAARLAKTGDTSQAAMSATPRLVMSGDQPAGRLDPASITSLPPEAEGIFAAGRGSLLTDPMSPATPNPSRAPVPAATQTKPGTGIKAPASSASGPAAGRPGGATSVPSNGGKIDSSSQASAATTSQTRAPQFVTINGKRAQLGASYVRGNRLFIIDVDASGNGVERDVTDVRDQWLRENVDQNAPLLFEKSALGAGARMLAAPMIKQGIADAGAAAMGGINKAGSDVVKTVGSLATQARNTLGNLFGGGSKPANTLASPAAQPTAGNTLVQTTITNPAYTEWVKKYGTSPVNPVAVSKLQDIHDRQAAALGYGALPPVPANRPAPPPAPPKTITVSKPSNNTLAAPAAPAAPKVQTTQTVSGKTVNVGQTYQSGGYLYSANPNGTFTKVGKVGAGNTLAPAVRSATSTTPASSAQKYAASAAKSVDRGTGGEGGNPTWW